MKGECTVSNVLKHALWGNSGTVPLNFTLYFEPEDGISTPREFTEALFAWADKEKKALVILEESMEPRIRLDGKHFLCRLAQPDLQAQRHFPLGSNDSAGFTHSLGRTLGYKWVYLYPADEA